MPSMQEVSSGGAYAATREARVASFSGPARPRPGPAQLLVDCWGLGMRWGSLIPGPCSMQTKRKDGRDTGTRNRYTVDSPNLRH